MGAAWALRAALWGLLLPQMSVQLGILHAFKSDQPLLSKDYCIFYNSDWTSLPSTLNTTVSSRLAVLTPRSLCSPSDVPPEGIKDKAVAVQRGNCTFLEKAQIAQNHGAKLLLVVAKGDLFPPSGNMTEYNVSIPIALIRDVSISDMNQVLGKNIDVTLYSPPWPNFDYSMVVLFLIAVLTVAVAGYWSGMIEVDILKASSSSEILGTAKKSNEDVTLNSMVIVVFVALCSVLLVLLYFFYTWLVYVVIAFFCLATTMSLYYCLAALLRKIPFGQCRLACCNSTFEVRLIFLAGICIAATAVWIVYRNEDRWIWILHNILSIALCLSFITQIKIPNFKLCVLFLSLLIVYDVFFVFITPYITKSGESIMIEVATGGSEGNEKLPMVFKVPRLQFSALTVCSRPFSLLGYGDVVLPGLLVAYCHRFDVRTNSSSVYFISCTVAYAVGLVVTFVALALMKTGQPALLYLVPFTVITSALVALCRKEMKKFWSGSTYQAMDTDQENAKTANEQQEGQ